MPKFYKLAEIRDGALGSKGMTKTRMTGEKFEMATQLIFEAVKIHSDHEEREWRDLCFRITDQMRNTFDGYWTTIASDREIYVGAYLSDDNYINIELDDLFIKVLRSPSE